MSFILDEANNYAQLAGKIVGNVEPNFETFGEVFYGFNLVVNRLSKEVDTIPVTISDKIIKANNLTLKEGDDVFFGGEFRSYNKNVGGKSRLMLHFFVQDVLNEESLLSNDDFDSTIGNYIKDNAPQGANHNLIKLEGYICKPPVYRITPFNREICDVLMAINRFSNSTKAFNKSDYIPCILWGRNARFVSNLPIGTKIKVVGRIQSRDYNKKQENGEIEVKTAYEVSCQSIAQVENSSNSKKEEAEIV